MENQQMAMPAEMAAAGPNPDEMAIYEQMRQEISPQEFSNEMLAGASQVDPQAVAEFTQELQGLDMPPEVLDALNDVVDEILANPERYAELRAQYMEQGLPEDLLPEQFDPQFFTALNMAIDQMIAAPTGVQAFAQGGIAELKPIAKAIASYGRNGDTMLAHITPAEARMLRRRGGSGTINPDTGLPEFFIKKLWKAVTKPLRAVGKAVKKFASSTVGRLVATVALGFFLGPAAASLMGVGSAAGVAAVSGFVGGAGSTLLAGGNLKDALKAGAIGGLTAGATAGVMGGADSFASGSASTAGMTPGQALQSRVDQFTNAVAPTPGLDAAGQAPVPGAQAGASAPYSDLKMTGTPVKPFPEFFGDQAPAATAGAPASGAQFGIGDPGAGFEPSLSQAASPDATQFQGSLAKPPASQPGMFDSAKQFYNENISPSGIREAGQQEAMSKTLAQFPNATAEQVMSAPANSVLGKAYQAALPGIFQTYGPATALGLGAMSAFGGFDTKPVQGGEITNSLMKPVTQRIQEKDTQRQMYMQGLPGVVYDDYGAPVYGQSTRLPTYDVPDYNSGGFGSPGQGIMNLPSVYVPPTGSLGSRSVAQPYNNSDMYSNIMPQRYADGGTVTDLYRTVLRRDPSVAEIDNWKTQFGDTIDERERAVFREAAGNELATQRTSAAELATQQKAARDAAAQKKALRRAAGSGSMYANINAGISALAPATNPMDPSETGFGARNRQMQLAKLETAYGPMLQKQRDAMNQQSTILGQPGQERPITTMPVTPPPGMQPINQPAPEAPTPSLPAYFTQNPDVAAEYQRNTYGLSPEQFAQTHFERYGQNEQRTAPAALGNTAALSMQQIANTPGMGVGGIGMNFDPSKVQFKGQSLAPELFMNMGGIAGLAQGGYPRRTGQISGPGTEKSDSIPAMLSDGEFVMTAKAVRGAGKGSRRAGAKQMYKLMHQLEKNAERG